MALNLAIIIGSTRPGRVGPSVAQWALDAAQHHDEFDARLVDLADFNLPLLDEPEHPSLKRYHHDHTKRWSEEIDGADAFVFVTPEYDYFAPASLVNAIQCLSQEWRYKPAGIVSYGGVSGGLRSTQTLRVLLSNMNVHTLPQSVSIQFVKQHLRDGIFTPPEHAPAGADTMLSELAKWAGALTQLR